MRLVLIVIAAWAGMGVFAAEVPRELRDDFEGGLKRFWVAGNYGSGRFEAGRMVTVTNFARSGKRSLRVTVKEGDVAQAGAEDTETERAEMDSGKWPLIGREVTYSFSILIPEDFPIVDTRLVISQLKQKDVSGPIVAQRFRDGAHTLTVEVGGKKSRYKLPKLTLGQWHDFKFRVKYETDRSGRLEVWMNGARVVEHKGPTADGKGVDAIYHKFGLYRDRMKEPMTAYFDDFEMVVK